MALGKEVANEDMIGLFLITDIMGRNENFSLFSGGFSSPYLAHYSQSSCVYIYIYIFLLFLFFFLGPWDILRQQNHGLDFCPITTEGSLDFSVDCTGDLFIDPLWLGCTSKRQSYLQTVGHTSVFTFSCKCFLELLSGFAELQTMLNAGIKSRMVIFILA